MRHPEKAGVDESFFDSAAVINRILVQQIFADARFGHRSSVNDFSSIGGASSSISASQFALHDPAKERTVKFPSSAPLSSQARHEGPQCVYELVEERSVDFLQVRKMDLIIGHNGPHDNTHCEPTEACQSGPESGYYGLPQRRKPVTESGPSDFYHNPIYASGGVIVGGLLDHVLYQLYSNPSILQLIKLLCGIRTKADVKRDLHLFKQYGAGCYLECIPMPEGFGVKTMNFDEGSSSGSSDSEETGTDPSNRMAASLSRAATVGKQKISDLFHHPQEALGLGSDSIDSDYMFDNRHKNFLHLYEHLALDRGMIPIGLLRLQGDDPKTVQLGIGGSSRCYAITNPLLDTIVLDTDQVFVLAREDML